MKGLLLVLTLLLLAAVQAFSQATFSGYMFGDYYFNAARDTMFNHTAPANSALNSAAPGPNSMQAFQFRRIYFTMDDKISDNFQARFRLEADQAATPGVTGPTANTSTGAIGSADELLSGKVAPFIKEANLTWKNIFEGSNAIFGLQLTPGFALSEAAWGYRFLEKTLMDQKGLVPSVDLGASLKGKLASDGTVNYWLMIANNDVSGTLPENNKFKRYYANLQVWPVTNLQATAYVDYNAAPEISNLAKTATVNNSTVTGAVFVGYGKSALISPEPTDYNFGAEVFVQSQQNGYKNSSGELASKNGLGFWVYGQYYFMPDLGVVARYDHYDPNTGSDLAAKYDSRNYALGGLVYKPDKNVYISPNVIWESYETPANGVSIDASVTARVTVWFIFL